MLNTLLFLGWVVIAIVIVRKRVHVHFTVVYGGGSRTKQGLVRDRAMISPTSTQDCISALVNLGCKRKQARAAVERASAQGPAEFEELLRRAIREAA